MKDAMLEKMTMMLIMRFRIKKMVEKETEMIESNRKKRPLTSKASTSVSNIF